MKYCKNCNTQLPDDAVFCTSCGTALTDEEGTTVLFGDKTDFEEGTTILNENDSMQNTTKVGKELEDKPQDNSPNDDKAMTIDAFYSRFASKKTKNWNKTVLIISFITGVASIGLAGMGNTLSIMDAVFYLTMGILMLKKKSWILPLVTTVYGGIFSVVSIIMSDDPVGAFAFVVGIFATISMRKINLAYNEYCTSEKIPEQEIWPYLENKIFS